MNHKNNPDFLYEKESYLIIEGAKEVWRQFGGAFQERIVDRSLSIAVRKRGLEVEEQKRINIYFDNQKVGIYIPDKVIEKKIILEIKCKPFITKEDERQFWNYLKATPYKLGFLINFSPKRLEFRRRVFDKARQKTSLA